MDGWGIAPPGPGNAITLARTPVFDELWSSVSARGAQRQRPQRRPAGRPDGQLRSRAPDARRRRGRAADADPDQRRRRHRRSRRTTRSCATRSPPRARAPGRHGLRRRRALRVRASARADRAWRPSCTPLDLVAALLHRRARHLADRRRAATCRRCRTACTEAGVGRVASVVGRFYAMDRDRRWERTQAAYDLHRPRPRRAPRHPTRPQPRVPPTQRGETDEFITATTVGAEGADPGEDSVLCFNFRPDRMREIVRALAEPGFGDGDEQLPGWRGRDGAPPVRAAGDDDRIPARLALSGGIRRRPRPTDTLARRARPGRRRPAARGRDREVRARHLLLQRRRGGSVAGRAPRAGPVPARRAHLRPQAADERARSRRRVRAGVRRRSSALLGDQLRQRRHGRAHRRDPGHDHRRADRRRVPAPGGGRRPRRWRRVRDHRRPRQRRADARGRREHQHRALPQPGAADRHRPRRRRCGPPARSPTSPQPCWRCWACGRRAR